MSKRMANGGPIGPPYLPEKMRRVEMAWNGREHNYHPETFTDRHHGRPTMISQRRDGQHAQFSHSSSDDEVFMDSRPMKRRPPVLRHPPPFPDNLEEFAVHPHHPVAETHHPEKYLHQDPYYHQRRHEQVRLEDLTPVYHERPRHRPRNHSVPATSHDSSSSHEPLRVRDHSRSREQMRGRAFHVVEPFGNFSMAHSSGESSDEGSLRHHISGSDEFEYAYHYGYGDVHNSSRDSKPSSGTSSGSSSSSHRYQPRNRETMTPGRGRRPSPNKGFLSGNTCSDKWTVVNKPRAEPPCSQIVWPAVDQRAMKHQPVPVPPPCSAPHMPHFNHPLLTNANPSVKHTPKAREMTISEKLHRFMMFIRSDNSARINDIQTIENAITGCHLDVKTVYEAEDVGVYQGRHTFSGKLMLNGVFLARAVGQVKRELKHECYKLALQVLRTKSGGEILKQHDIGIEAIRQKFEECSRTDTNVCVSDAVVNLASAAPIAVAVETVATTEERWVDFINYLKALNTDMGNTISRIELALSGSRCGLERVYVDMSIMDPIQGKPGFQGSLTLGGVLQAQGQGNKKKEAKQKTYDFAYQRFTTMEVADILKGVEPQNLEEYKKEKPVRVVIKEIQTAEHIKKFELFIDRIKDSSLREGPITLLDLTSNQLQLLITCMYKRTEDQDGVMNLCQLFIGDILLSEGEGRHKKEAQADAYSKAYETLISTPLDTLITESHRLNKEELLSPDVHDVVVKGQIRKEESNLPRLRHHFVDVEAALSEKPSSEMVLVEHEDWIHDRKRHAFCILQNSALLNAMLLKWCTDIETGFFICRVHLQGEDLGMAKAHSRQQARNLASADALFKMYETHPVLRLIGVDHSSLWITRAQLTEKMSEMSETDFKEAEEEWENYLLRQSAKSEGEDSSTDGAELTDEQKEEAKMECRLKVMAVKEVEQFQQRGDILDELVFAPDLPQNTRRHITSIMTKMGLRAVQRQKDGKIYMIVQFRVRADKVVAAMEERGVVKTSRFMLVEDRICLPCHAEIAMEIEAARTLTRPDRISSRMHPKSSSDKESRDAATGSSLNGSLFEETMEGFVTAHSYMIGEANASLQPPAMQSTPQTPPSKKCVLPKPTPAAEVYTKFARAMMASGIGQTLVPMESSTPVSSNILINPPKSDSLAGGKGGAPVIKNILVSPPKAKGTNVTISSPMKDLTVSSSSTFFPQPDFCTPPSPEKSEKPATDKSQSSTSTVLPNSTTSSAVRQSLSLVHTDSLPELYKPAGLTGLRQNSQQVCGKPPLPPAPKCPVGAGHGSVTNQKCAIAKTSASPDRRGGQKFGAGHPVQNRFQKYGRYNRTDHADGGANRIPPRTDGGPGRYAHVSVTNGTDTGNRYPQSSVTSHTGIGKGCGSVNSGGGGAYYRNHFQQQELPAWHPVDPSAPHAIQMSPAGDYGGYHRDTEEFTKDPEVFPAVDFVYHRDRPTQDFPKDLETFPAGEYGGFHRDMPTNDFPKDPQTFPAGDYGRYCRDTEGFPNDPETFPAGDYGSYHRDAGFPKETDGFRTAMYMENEVPVQSVHGRRWNH